MIVDVKLLTPHADDLSSSIEHDAAVLFTHSGIWIFLDDYHFLAK